MRHRELFLWKWYVADSHLQGFRQSGLTVQKWIARQEIDLFINSKRVGSLKIEWK